MLVISEGSTVCWSSVKAAPCAGHQPRRADKGAGLRALASDIYKCPLELSDPTAHRVPQSWGRHTAAHDVPVCGEAGIESRSVPLHTTRSCLSVVKQALKAFCATTHNTFLSVCGEAGIESRSVPLHRERCRQDGLV